MKIAEGEVHGLPLLVFEGEMDHNAKLPTREAVDAILLGAFPPQSLLLDLTGCRYIDSGGLGVIISALRQLPPTGWLGLIGVNANIKRILTYAGLLDIDRVRFFSSVNDAASSIARDPMLPLAAEPGPPEYQRPLDVWERWELGGPT